MPPFTFRHNDKSNSDTCVSPAGRASAQELKALAGQVLENPLVRVVLETVNGQVLVLNRRLQVLAANRLLMEHLGVHTIETLMGRRPGELYACQHCHKAPDGCGALQQCRHCGVVLAIMSAQSKGKSAEKSCRLISLKNGRRTIRKLKVRATPLKIDNHRLLVIVLEDIGAKKRRRPLKRDLLPDAGNNISPHRSIAELHKMKNFKGTLDRLSDINKQLIRKIKDQSLLTRAEYGGLTAKRDFVSVDDIFNKLKALYAGQDDMLGKNFEIFCKCRNTRFVTDSSLLLIVLIHMMRNAFEASDKGATVRLWFDRSRGRPAFFIHNSGAIPSQIARRIFQRNFNTKSISGCYVDTYSMKLLGEQVLGGEVSFTTNVENGTTFSIVLPII